MASVTLTLGRWTILTALGVAGAAACGGRNTLPVGSMDDEGGSSFGNSGGGGASATGGTRPKAGASTGGSVSGSSAGGAIGTGGGVTAGAGGFAGCGPGAQCPMPYVCQNGACVLSQVCAPGQAFCDQNVLRQCNMQGTGFVLFQVCGAGQYCDVATLGCRQGVCAPNQPWCNGEVATSCNQNGSGFNAPFEDCSQQGLRHCEQGVCVCDADMADCVGGPRCETDLSTDQNNCGSCGQACSSNNMATRTCNGGCDGVCQAGFDDCNQDKQSDGCETQIDADIGNCGGCGISCSSNHVSPSCTDGTCSGACQANFADCNQDKQSDGCESDARTDVNNCGGCGVRCSSNRISRVCSAGKCGGTCSTGFADCNGNKQTDGCEIDTRSNNQHCGGCNMPCAAGQACSSGQCGSLFTFSGVKQSVPVASLIGWTQCHVDHYGDGAPLEQVLSACSGSQLMMACRLSGSSTLQLAAHAPRADVLFDTGNTDTPHAANGVGWYFSRSRSWGFAPQGSIIRRNTCDVVASALDPSGTDPDTRLCWHTGSNSLEGGWRCGKNDDLNDDLSLYERVLFHAP